MSELHPKDYEQLITPEQDQHRQEELAMQHELQKDAKNKHADNIDTIRETIEQQASTHEVNPTQIAHERHNEHRPHHYLTKSIKAQQYKKTMADVRKSLPSSQQRFSKIVHQPAIERVSEVAAKTVVRPSGIIGGALFALIGSTFIMYTARRIGFELPNTIFAILFIVGFIAGVFIELLFYSLTRMKKRKSISKHY